MIHNSKPKLLIICGPTATGKTSLALELAQELSADIISADSRQVYKGMDVGTGKDIPENFKYQISNIKFTNRPIGYYTNNTTKIWGLDLVNPDEEFSVSEYVRFAVPVIESTWKENKLPIVVGGTGLYIRALVQPLADISIPQDDQLRRKLALLTVSQLQQELQQLDRTYFERMNNSDQNNSRRLVRAIEMVTWKKQHQVVPQVPSEFYTQSSKLILGLTAPQEKLFERINARVEKRIEQGMIEEIKTLLAKGYSWNLKSMSGLGYRQWQDYFEKTKTLTETTELWKKEERAYAKRQLTWFKKEPGVEWFDYLQEHATGKIKELVKKWYTK